MKWEPRGGQCKSSCPVSVVDLRLNGGAGWLRKLPGGSTKIEAGVEVKSDERGASLQVKD